MSFITKLFKVLTSADIISINGYGVGRVSIDESGNQLEVILFDNECVYYIDQDVTVDDNGEFTAMDTDGVQTRIIAEVKNGETNKDEV